MGEKYAPANLSGEAELGSRCSFTEGWMCTSCSCAALESWKQEQIKQPFPLRAAEPAPGLQIPPQSTTTCSYSKTTPLLVLFSGHICMLRFDIFTKDVASGVLFASTTGYLWESWSSLHHFRDGFMGMLRQSREFLPGCQGLSGGAVPAPQPAGSQRSRISNKCSWTIFRVWIVPSVRAALGGFNYGLHSVFKHLDSFFHPVNY